MRSLVTTQEPYQFGKYLDDNVFAEVLAQLRRAAATWPRNASQIAKQKRKSSADMRANVRISPENPLLMAFP
jgi:hypothetical protein